MPEDKRLVVFAENHQMARFWVMEWFIAGDITAEQAQRAILVPSEHQLLGFEAGDLDVRMAGDGWFPGGGTQGQRDQLFSALSALSARHNNVPLDLRRWHEIEWRYRTTMAKLKAEQEAREEGRRKARTPV